MVLEQAHALVGVPLLFPQDFELGLQVADGHGVVRVGLADDVVVVVVVVVAAAAASYSLAGIFNIAEQGQVGSGGDGVELVGADFPVHAAEVLGEVFLAGEALAAASFAVGVGALVAGFGPAVLAVDFALVAEQTAGVCEAADFLAAGFEADVGPVVFISVLPVDGFRILFSWRDVGQAQNQEKRKKKEKKGEKISIDGRDEKLTYIHTSSRTLEARFHNLCEDTGTPLCRWFPRPGQPCSVPGPVKGFFRSWVAAGSIDVGIRLRGERRCKGWGDKLALC